MDHLHVFGKIQFSAHFFNQIVLLWLLLSCMDSLYILDISSLSDLWFAKFFFHLQQHIWTLKSLAELNVGQRKAMYDLTYMTNLKKLNS